MQDTHTKFDIYVFIASFITFRAEALTTGQIMLSGTNRPPEEILTQW
jgi:hypothetical protein